MKIKRRHSVRFVLFTALAVLAMFCLRNVASPVHAQDAPGASEPILVNGDTANITFKLFTDEHHTQVLDGPVTSTSRFYGAFSASFLTGKAPLPGKNVAICEFPDTIVVDDNAGGDIMEGTDANAVKAGTWKIENNKIVYTFDENWLALNPTDIHVATNFSFHLVNTGSGSGGGASIEFPGAEPIVIPTKDGDLTGTKSGTFSQGADGVAKVDWTVKLSVESYATNVKFTDTLGDNFDFVGGSFMLDGKKLDPQPTIDGQTAVLETLGNLFLGEHTIVYQTKLKSGVSAKNCEFINDQDASKNTATWEWGGTDDRKSNSATAAPGKFRYDMINKSNGSGTQSDITWTVTLNQGELKADMSGYVFTDTLDGKQTYTGNYTVYKGRSGSEVLETGRLDPSQNTFTYTFSTNLADKYVTYRIVYHTKMNDVRSYDTVRNNATIERKGSVSGADKGSFTPQLVGKPPITKSLVRFDEAATTGRATWETSVALKAIVNAVHPDKVTVNDTFQSAWSQNLGVDEGSITITIGKTVLVRGSDWGPTSSYPGNGAKKNYNLNIYVNDKVKAALENEDYAVITYATTSDALSGWYSNFASVSATGLKLQRSYTDPVMYVVNQETTPAVEKPEAESKVTWDGDFDWSAVDGTDEKGAWVVDWTVYANRQKGNKGANGEFEYYGAGKLNGVPLNIVDTLPDGMSYVAGSAKYTLVQNPYDQHTGLGHIDGIETVVAKDQSLAAGNVSGAGNTVTFSIPTTALDKFAGYAKLTYKTAVKRGALDASANEVKFTNSASAESGDKKFDSGSGTVTIKNNVIEKTSEQLGNSNRIKYTIFVNESAVDLKAASDFLELVDVMDAKCMLVPSTLKVYEQGDVDWKELSKNDYSSKMEQVKSDGGTRTRLTLTVPDNKYLKVEYEVIPSGNPGDKVSLSNTARLTGVTEGLATDEKIWTVKSASATAGGNGYGITMTKYDAQQVGATLKGAEFTLYKVDVDRAATDGVENARTWFQTAKTDANGKISFGTSDKAMADCVLYQLVETGAPEGYAAAEPTWIMLKGNARDDVYQGALAKARSIVGNAEIDDAKRGEIWVYDDRLTGSADILAKKELQGGVFKAGQFSFVLKDGDGRVLKTVTNDPDGNVSFHVEYNKAGEYHYTISEVVPEDAENNVKDHITYDTTEHKVTVTVNNGNGKLDTAVAYDNGSSTSPTFTNKYSTTLPAAGRTGTTATYLAGSVLLAIVAVRMHLYRTGAKKGGESRE